MVGAAGPAIRYTIYIANINRGLTQKSGRGYFFKETKSCAKNS